MVWDARGRRVDRCCTMSADKSAKREVHSDLARRESLRGQDSIPEAKGRVAGVPSTSRAILRGEGSRKPGMSVRQSERDRVQYVAIRKGPLVLIDW